MTFARDNNIPLVLTLGGGYAKPIELSVEAHLNTYRCAAEIFSPDESDENSEQSQNQKS
jgi:acetoin utilization deacetylase AcuC-like enzyme